MSIIGFFVCRKGAQLLIHAVVVLLFKCYFQVAVDTNTAVNLQREKRGNKCRSCTNVFFKTQSEKKNFMRT